MLAGVWLDVADPKKSWRSLHFYLDKLLITLYNRVRYDRNHFSPVLARLPALGAASLAIKDDLLDPVDQLLDDPARVELVRQSLARRYPRSTLTGRPGMAPDRLLRCCVMKHLKGWSFRDLERN